MPIGNNFKDVLHDLDENDQRQFYFGGNIVETLPPNHSVNVFSKVETAIDKAIDDAMCITWPKV
jgi:hypothetical protein